MTYVTYNDNHIIPKSYTFIQPLEVEQMTDHNTLFDETWR